MLTSLILVALAQGPAAEDQVRCAEIAFSRAVETGDLEAFERFIDPDARFTGAQVLRGRAAVVDGWRVFFEAGGPSIEWAPDSVEVLESGDLAFSQGCLPLLKIKMITPAVKSAVMLICIDQKSAEAPVSPRPDSFQKAHRRILPFELDARKFQFGFQPGNAFF